MGQTMPRRGSTRRGRRWAARVIRGANVCGICGKVLDKTLTWPDPWSPSADHIVAYADAPELRFDPKNGRASHLICNQQRGRGQIPDVPQSAIW
ncbi:MAG: HNH endonuclease [Gemmatimonadota bacterium]|nr:HNH endonuclease [Gemmatimonadota bacterium]